MAFLPKIVTDFTSTLSNTVKGVTSLPSVKTGLAVTSSYTDGQPGEALILALSTAWIGLGPAAMVKRDLESLKGNAIGRKGLLNNPSRTEALALDRQDFKQPSYLRLGDTVLPPTQTYELRGGVETNSSQLIDGIDVIQLTRKKAKTIDCEIKFVFSPRETDDTFSIRGKLDEIRDFATVIRELADSLAVFEVANERINSNFGVTYAIMTEYRFRENAGSNICVFNFTLVEVAFGANVLTLDARTTSDSTRRTIG